VKKRMINLIGALAFLCTVAILANSAYAEVLLPNPLTGPSHGFASNWSGGVGYAIADDFTLNTNAIINDVHWWGFYNGLESGGDLPEDNFTINFWTDDSGMPGDLLTGTSLTVTRTGTGFIESNEEFPNIDSDIYYYAADLAEGVGVTGGETYYIELFNSTADRSWCWSDKRPAIGDLWYRSGNLPGWSPHETGVSDTDMYFELTGTSVPIPEPATVLLLGTGLVGLVGFRKKFKK
jgi:hypothetical protein